ncbi:MAG: YcaO-like family protein [Candidatus Pacebacteria bacterium]|nr:YcaO-like family protein [Candidatus Paceibacterota bacterium]
MPKIWLGVLSILERYIQEPLYINTPPIQELTEGDIAKIRPAISAAHALKENGIIDFIEKQKRIYDDEPPFYAYRAVSPKNHGYEKNSGHGVHFFSEKRALWRTLGECVERFLWRYENESNSEYITASYEEMPERTLDIFSVVGFSNEQRADNKFIQFTEKTPLRWVPSTSLISNKKIYCPAQFSSAYYMGFVQTPFLKDEKSRRDEPMLRWCVSTGLATGASTEDALVSGILEIIERDAFMISYLNKLTPPQVDLEELALRDKEVSLILKSFKRHNLEAYVLELPTDFPVAVYCTVIKDKSGVGPSIAVGASADFDKKTCLLDSMSEALSVRVSVRSLSKRHSNKIKNMNQDGRLIHWAQKEQLEKLNFFLGGEKKKCAFTTNKTGRVRHGKEELKELIHSFKKNGQELCYVDLTTKETRGAGFFTVNVIAPEMQPLHLNEFVPYLSGKRLREVPEKLGYTSAETLNTEPHPFP